MKRRTLLKTGLLGFGALVAPTLPAIAKTPSLLDPNLLKKAKAALDTHHLPIKHTDVIGIADYALHSAKPRFHLVDLMNGRTTSFLVAHGRGSDKRHTGWLQKFSNIPGSEASSGGSYVTGQAYIGKHGRSRRLAGLDPSNDLAYQRAIVIHGAWYVDSKMVKQYGKVGRSQGCFAFSETDLDHILQRLGTGRMLFADKGSNEIGTALI
ncbi:murein L,D-transpeptidase catalytic domain family protein [Sphingorhabdus sp. EL138]|uniref:murein L,D-transpeptidase catalytic domain family protein n=1 Tax=Sphingorhabdus sp. EL138 TaxID=2073156 RepID=UPI000D691378|nr:murein L,D-transpeptidase catalytic domain family protein [Sphingorhabdus sp. EL138]